ncbi:hypothetical protein MPC4_10340 [Methylocella tundrae]|uniref:Uncharacterized protein n=1 Tax=Methylocella tundrae TaxID=227605 RepID=A0A8B6M2C5_METTU|nr:hypothetical protein MPC4_10340 [Methylocella tundrae]
MFDGFAFDGERNLSGNGWIAGRHSKRQPIYGRLRSEGDARARLCGLRADGNLNGQRLCHAMHRQFARDANPMLVDLFNRLRHEVDHGEARGVEEGVATQDVAEQGGSSVDRLSLHMETDAAQRRMLEVDRDASVKSAELAFSAGKADRIDGKGDVSLSRINQPFVDPRGAGGGDHGNQRQRGNHPSQMSCREGRSFVGVHHKTKKHARRS